MQAIRRLALRRSMHGHAPDHGHGHGHHEPPRFLGLHPGREREAFELPTKIYFLGLGVLIGLTVLVPETRLTEWAKDEVEERRRRKEAGEDVEFGHNYFSERTRAELLSTVKRRE